MRQLTREEAIAFSDTDAYAKMTEKEVAAFQLQQELLCVPMNEFKRVLEVALHRPVFTHELVNPASLLKELYGEKEPPTFDEILGLIPKGKKVVIVEH